MAVLCVEDLDHLVLTVADIKATCRFYQQVLGMTPFTFGNGRTALSFGNRKINLHEVGKGYLPQAHNPLPGTADLCFLSRTPAVEMLDQRRLARPGVSDDADQLARLDREVDVFDGGLLLGQALIV